MTPQQKAKLDAIIAAISARAKLDADIDALSADYATRRGLKEYSHKALLEETFPLETKTKTDPADRYPTPDSHRPQGQSKPTLNRRSSRVDLDAYHAEVARLREAGYMSVQEAVHVVGKNVFVLRADVGAGLLKAVDAIGHAAKGFSHPRYFVHPDELTRYSAWYAAGRPMPRKPNLKRKRGAIAQEGA